MSFVKRPAAPRRNAKTVENVFTITQPEVLPVIVRKVSPATAVSSSLTFVTVTHVKTVCVVTATIHMFVSAALVGLAPTAANKSKCVV